MQDDKTSKKYRHDKNEMQRIKKIVLVLILHCCCLLPGYAQLKSSYLQMGRYELSQEHFTKAIEYFNLAIGQQSQSFDAYFFRAIAKEELDDYIGSEKDYTKSISIYSSWVDAYISRALVRDKMFNYQGAFEDYDKAILLDSLNPVIYFNRAITYLALQKFQLAIDDCNHAERLKYNNENLYIVRGAAKSGLTQYENAIKDFGRVISKNHKNIFAYMQRAETWVAMEKKDSAIADLNFVLKHDSLNTDALLNRAILKIDDKKNAEALKDLNKVIRLSPDNATAYFNRAMLKSDMKDYNGSLYDYDKVLEIHPQNILAYYNRAGLKYSHHDLKGALEDYNKVIALFPNFSDAYENRSQVEKDLNKPEDSKRDHDKSVEIHNSNTSLSDSARVEESAKLMKFMSLSAGSESQNNSKEKVQYSNADIQPQSIFSVTMFPAQKKFRLYKVPLKNKKDSVLTLVNTPADSLDEAAVFNKINALTTVIEKDSLNAGNYFNRAILYATVQKYNQSIADYNMSIKLDSTNVMAWFSRANTRYKLLELLYSFDDVPAFDASGNVPKTYQKRVYTDNTYDMVLNDYAKALQLDPEFTYAWFNTATTKIKTNDYKGAVADYTMALSCDPSLSEVYYNRGLLLIVLHDNNNACIDLSKAGELGILEAYNVIKRFCYK
ncbi:MAG: hypothetical protein JWP12_1784 [Bacteroidetes bacterium]|nr:hypothetical protein [Bacteroidota bacterium]